MTHLRAREIDEMSAEARVKRLVELREELLQLSAQKALGGSVQNAGEFKQTRRSIARLLTKMNQE
jgi:ribosomal protein L29